MAHRVQSVSMIDQNILQAIFIGGEVIQYDLRKMLSILPQFQEIINNPSLASKVHADTGGYGVSWSDDLDLDSETIWEDGVFIRIESVDPSLALASSLARAREYAMLTQKQLSEKTGIYQSDISKLERGNANPSILTLKRLADAMDMTLKIEFVPKKMKRLSQPLHFFSNHLFSISQNQYFLLIDFFCLLFCIIIIEKMMFYAVLFIGNNRFQIHIFHTLENIAFHVLVDFF